MQSPGALKRLGKEVFVKVPLYEAKRRYKAAYINQPLFSKLFPSKTGLSLKDMSALILKYFNTTIEPENSTGKKIGYAYVDRQYDPLGLSLSGNLGSGRAYYAGKVFNIKGEKTPLATSEQRRFSDGLLEMERCVWETFIANALQGAVSNGLNSVLAILDMDEKCDVIWREHPVKRGKIIRIDSNGELDRITHLFYNKKPLRKAALKSCAKAYGILEADKFAERILHGAWSPGNISLKGHLIDFDTVCTVKGRAPQYSFTRWHYQNYFGYEIHGQLEILKSLAADPVINAGKLPFDTLRDTAFSSLQERLLKRFISLMGFKNEEKIYRAYQQELKDIVELWVELARKTYKDPKNFSVKLAPSVLLHVFDFSAFFRVYPLLKRLDRFTPVEAVKLLCGGGYLKQSPDKQLHLPIEREHRDKLYSVIGEHFVTAQDDFQLLRIAALGFVKNYDALHQKITTETKQDIKQTEARAYIINEDRSYMFPAYTASYFIGQNVRTMTQGLIDALIVSGQRNAGESGQGIADIRLYNEGYSFRLLDGKGAHQVGFHFFEERDLSKFVSILRKKNKYQIAKRIKKKLLLTRKISNGEILEDFCREASLQENKLSLLLHNSRIDMREIPCG